MKKLLRHQLHCVNEINGFSTILAVVIVGAVALTVVLSVSVTILSAGRISGEILSSYKSKAYADACMEQGLMEIRRDTGYSGTDSLVLSDGTCSYTVINTGGATREIQAIGSVNGSIKKIKANISQISPKIIIDYWREVADF